MIKTFCGPILHFIAAPSSAQDSSCYEYIEDGLLVVENGKIAAIGPRIELQNVYGHDITPINCSPYLIMPGWIDAHIHYPQIEVIASYGQHLLDWLNQYVFPAESKYDSKEYAKSIASFFLAELLRHGTTTAAVYSTVHASSAEALFEQADKLNMQIITGKILMDRNAPLQLTDTPETAYNDSKKLIEKWHGHNRLLYAVTPRFAPTSSEAELEIAARLLREHPSVYLQTHISENKPEVSWVQQLFPWSKDYTDVYDHYHLLGPKSIFAHAIYFTEREFTRFYETESVIAWCPASNFFLGSGLFKLGQAQIHKNRLSIGTDVGGGAIFSMQQTLAEAYKVAALQSIPFSALEGFYAITLGNARALSLDHKIGNFTPSKNADFVVINLNSTPLLCNKMKYANSLEEKLFNLMILGDDRAIHATYVNGVNLTPKDYCNQKVEK